MVVIGCYFIGVCTVHEVCSSNRRHQVSQEYFQESQRGLTSWSSCKCVCVRGDSARIIIVLNDRAVVLYYADIRGSCSDGILHQ